MALGRGLFFFLIQGMTLTLVGFLGQSQDQSTNPTLTKLSRRVERPVAILAPSLLRL